MSSIGNVQPKQSMENPSPNRLSTKQKYEALKDIDKLSNEHPITKDVKYIFKRSEGYGPLTKLIGVTGIVCIGGYLAANFYMRRDLASMGKWTDFNEKIVKGFSIYTASLIGMQSFFLSNKYAIDPNDYKKVYTIDPYKQLANRISDIEKDPILKELICCINCHLLIEPHISPIPPHNAIYEKETLNNLEKGHPGFVFDPNRNGLLAKESYKAWPEMGIIVNARIEFLLKKELEKLPKEKNSEEKALEQLYTSNIKIAHDFYVEYYNMADKELESKDFHLLKHFKVVFPVPGSEINWDLDWKEILENRFQEGLRIDEVRKSWAEFKKQPI